MKDTFGGVTYRGHVRPVGLEALVSSNSAYWELRWNASLTGATFVNDADPLHSGVEFDTAATALADGVVVASGYFSAGSGNTRIGNAIGIATKLLLGRTYGNVRDTLTLAARGVAGTSNVAVSIAFDELY